MKKIILIIIIALLTNWVYSQKPQRCGQVEFYNSIYQNNPEQKNEDNKTIQRLYNYKLFGGKTKKANTTSDIYIIPVVVHIIGDDAITTVSANNNQRVTQQIQILNEDYRKISGTHGDGAGVDCEIEFCLARIDPSGNATTGITTTTGNYQSWNQTDDATLKGLVHWDPSKYLNLYVVSNPYFISNGQIRSLLGYATFPWSLSTNPAVDGVVINVESFGSTESAAYGLGATAVHEVGHWLGMRHTWGDTNDCTGDDGISDTPICSGATAVGTSFNNCSGTQQCTAENTNVGSTDVRQVENYMDYSEDICLNRFTADQRDRMHQMIDNLRPDLDASVACNAVIGVPHCQNGIQDINENGVDCGGPDCLNCGNGNSGTAGNCHDGIQNHGETGVDCGGPCYRSCPPAHCFNGIKDGNEDRVDCGGDCPACSIIDICSNNDPLPIQPLQYTDQNGGCYFWTTSGNGFVYCDRRVGVFKGDLFDLTSKSILLASLAVYSLAESYMVAEKYIDIIPACSTTSVDIGLGSFWQATINNFSCTSNFDAYQNGCITTKTGVSFLIDSGRVRPSELLVLYPTPTSQNLTIEYPDCGTIVIRNSLSEEIYKENRFCDKTSISVQALPAGLYYCSFFNAHNWISKIFLKI